MTADRQEVATRCKKCGSTIDSFGFCRCEDGPSAASPSEVELLKAERDYYRRRLRWAYRKVGEVGLLRIGSKERVRRLNAFRDRIQEALYG